MEICFFPTISTELQCSAPEPLREIIRELWWNHRSVKLLQKAKEKSAFIFWAVGGNLRAKQQFHHHILRYLGFFLSWIKCFTSAVKLWTLSLEILCLNNHIWAVCHWKVIIYLRNYANKSSEFKEGIKLPLLVPGEMKLNGVFKQQFLSVAFLEKRSQVLKTYILNCLKGSSGLFWNVIHRCNHPVSTSETFWNSLSTWVGTWPCLNI